MCYDHVDHVLGTEMDHVMLIMIVIGLVYQTT